MAVIPGVLSMAAANAALALGAFALLRPFKTGQRPLDALMFLLLRLGLMSAVVLAAGCAGRLRPLPLGLAGAAALLPLLARRPRLPRVERIGLAVILPAAALAVRLLLQVLVFAPASADVLSYHLPKVAEWVRAGAFTRELGVDDHAAFPAGFELVETWWVVFLHHDVLIEMAGLEFLALSAAAAAALASRLGLGPRGSAVAALLVVLTPGLHAQATSCLNDGPAAACWVATAALLAARASPALVALAVGLGLGIKPTYAVALPGLAWLAFRARRDAPLPRGGRTAEAALVSVALLVGLFWYGRNLLWFGNPLHPLGGAALPIQQGPSAASLWRNLGELAGERILDRRTPYGAYLDGIAGWGPVAVACGLPALILFLRRSADARRVAAAFGIAAACVLLFSAPDPWSMRFILFVPVLLALAVAWLWESGGLRPWIPAIGLAVQIFGTFLPYDLPRSRVEALWRQPWAERSAANFFEVRAAGDRVGYLADNRGPAYLLYGPDFSRRVVYLRSTSPTELLSDMEREGLTLLCAVPDGGPRQALLEACVREGRLKPSGGKMYALAPRR